MNFLGKATVPTAHEANYSLVVLLAVYILSFVDRQILSLLVGPVKKDLLLTDFQMSLLQGIAFASFYVFMGIPLGRLADKRSRKLLISIGVFTWSAMTFACGLSSNFTSLFFARMGVGVGEAALSPAAYSILSDSFKPDKLARATSIFTMGITIGGGFAFIVGGYIVAIVSGVDSVVLPLIGGTRRWQLCFLVVSVPGILLGLLALTIKEPARRWMASGGSKNEITLAETFEHIYNNWQIYASLFFGVSLLSIIGNGVMGWYPTFFNRTYGVALGGIGWKFGLIYLIFGSIGAFSGALFSERLRSKGFSDANFRVVYLVGIGLLIPSVITPLMPSIALAYAMTALTVFLLNAFFGVSIAALQLITPIEMRAAMAALFLLTTNLLGLGVGPSSIAFMTDYVFANEGYLRYSLSVVSLIACPLSVLVCGAGLKYYRAALWATNGNL